MARIELDVTSLDDLRGKGLTFTTVTESGPSGNPVVAIEGTPDDLETWVRNEYAQDPTDDDEVYFHLGHIE